MRSSEKLKELRAAQTHTTTTRKTSAQGKRGTRKNAGAGAQTADKSEYDIPVASTEEEEEEARPVAKAQNRRRPPRTMKKATQTEAQKLAIERLQKRMEADLEANAVGVAPEERDRQVRKEQHREPAVAVEASSPQTRSPVAPARAVPGSAVRPPQSVLRMQNTPAAESSVLALANFRRRPRQPSLLQMVQQGEVGENTTDFSLGLGEDEDDFAPEDESTPLQVSKTQDAPAVGTDVYDDDELYAATPRPSPKPNPRKRKSDEMEGHEDILVIRSSPPRSESPMSTVEDELPEALVESIPATAPEDNEDEDAEPRESQSDTFAEPLSSSPPPMPRSITETQIRHQSPDEARKSRKTKAKTLDSATLRALLPKRRIRPGNSPRREARSDFDIPTSSDMGLETSPSEADEDDLALRGQKKGSRTTAAKSKASSKGRSKAAPSQRRAPTRPGVLSPATRKQTAPIRPAQTSAMPNGSGKRTYGRSLPSSDKENEALSSELSELVSEDEEADASLETVAPKKKANATTKSSELDAARKKFEQIDEWEMEFESASLGADGSSPWR